MYAPGWAVRWWSRCNSFGVRGDAIQAPDNAGERKVPGVSAAAAAVCGRGKIDR